MRVIISAMVLAISLMTASVVAAAPVIVRDADVSCTFWQEDRTSALCAQWAAVDTARIGTAFSVISIIALIISLGFARSANKAARKSAEAAIAMIDAERAMIELVDARAVLNISEIIDGIPSGWVSFSGKWKNLGPRVALEVKATAIRSDNFNSHGRPMDIIDPFQKVADDLYYRDQIEFCVSGGVYAMQDLFHGVHGVTFKTSVSYRDRMQIGQPVEKTLEYRVRLPKNFKSAKVGELELVLEPYSETTYTWWQRFWRRMFTKFPGLLIKGNGFWNSHLQPQTQKAKRRR